MFYNIGPRLIFCLLVPFVIFLIETVWYLDQTKTADAPTTTSTAANATTRRLTAASSAWEKRGKKDGTLKRIFSRGQCYIIYFVRKLQIFVIS